jgi:hypothetical protein
MENKLSFIPIILVCILIGFILGDILSSCKRNTYRDGPIDAINGKIFYHLEKNEDGSMSWIYKKQTKGN